MKKKLVEDKEKFAILAKERINQQENELKDLRKQKEELTEDTQRAEKQINVLNNEREKMRIKIGKLKRRRNVDLNQKICKNCGLEYLEPENFNWSCRTHRSEYGGEMWWCCGKRSKESQGCKFSKHETKDDEDEENQNEDGEKDKVKRIKCFCCRDVGHLAHDCIRDPNIKTGADIEDELFRIGKYSDAKKSMKDSFDYRNLMFEKLIREKKDEAGAVSPYKSQDLLTFDDYNYKVVNKVVFSMTKSHSIIVEDKDEDEEEVEEEKIQRDPRGVKSYEDISVIEETKSGDGDDSSKPQMKFKKRKEKLFNEAARNSIREKQETDLFIDIV